MRTEDFDFGIPKEAAAQVPMEPRDHSRLLVMDRQTGELGHDHFSNLPKFLSKGDSLVFNDSRVIKARVKGISLRTWRDVVILLIRPLGELLWEGMVEEGEVRESDIIDFPQKDQLQIISIKEKIGKRSEYLVTIKGVTDEFLDTVGEAPVPPYISGYKGPSERYQTVYAKIRGSSAAPTAGLHFTDRLLEELREKGIRLCFVTLHVGIDTFMPVYEDSPEEHKMYTEYCYIGEEVVDILRKTKAEGKKVIGVGTTSCRTMETASPTGCLMSFSGPTSLYILPGYKWKIVDGMITNFHYPRSTNLMMVSAFAGLDNIRRSYQVALEKGYRFYSFGDSTLLI